MADRPGGPRLILLAKPGCSACDDAEPALRGIAAALGIGWRRERSDDPRVPVVLLRREGGGGEELAAGAIEPGRLARAARRALGGPIPQDRPPGGRPS